jgi:hypothetical protein
MAERARKNYLMGDQSLRDFFREPVRYLRESNVKESQFEKPYLTEAYRKMHLEFPDWRRRGRLQVERMDYRVDPFELASKDLEAVIHYPVPIVTLVMDDSPPYDAGEDYGAVLRIDFLETPHESEEILWVIASGVMDSFWGGLEEAVTVSLNIGLSSSPKVLIPSAHPNGEVMAFEKRAFVDGKITVQKGYIARPIYGSPVSLVCNLYTRILTDYAAGTYTDNWVDNSNGAASAGYFSVGGGVYVHRLTADVPDTSGANSLSVATYSTSAAYRIRMEVIMFDGDNTTKGFVISFVPTSPTYYTGAGEHNLCEWDGASTWGDTVGVLFEYHYTRVFSSADGIIASSNGTGASSVELDLRINFFTRLIELYVDDVLKVTGTFGAGVASGLGASCKLNLHAHEDDGETVSINSLFIDQLTH